MPKIKANYDLNSQNEYKDIYDFYLSESINELENIINKRVINIPDFEKENIEFNIDKNSYKIYKKLLNTKEIDRSIALILKKNKDEIIEHLTFINKNKTKNLKFYVRPKFYEEVSLITDKFLDNNMTDNDFERVFDKKDKYILKLDIYRRYLSLKNQRPLWEKEFYAHSEEVMNVNLEYSLIILHLINIMLNNPYRK